MRQAVTRVSGRCGTACRQLVGQAGQPDKRQCWRGSRKPKSEKERPCDAYGSPRTGGGEVHLGHHPKKAGPRWGTPRVSPPPPDTPGGDITARGVGVTVSRSAGRSVGRSVGPSVRPSVGRRVGEWVGGAVGQWSDANAKLFGGRASRAVGLAPSAPGATPDFTRAEPARGVAHLGLHRGHRMPQVGTSR